jgi:hypothetical protein
VNFSVVSEHKFCCLSFLVQINSTIIFCSEVFSGVRGHEGWWLEQERIFIRDLTELFYRRVFVLMEVPCYFYSTVFDN